MADGHEIRRGQASTARLLAPSQHLAAGSRPAGRTPPRGPGAARSSTGWVAAEHRYLCEAVGGKVPDAPPSEGGFCVYDVSRLAAAGTRDRPRRMWPGDRRGVEHGDRRRGRSRRRHESRDPDDPATRRSGLDLARGGLLARAAGRAEKQHAQASRAPRRGGESGAARLRGRRTCCLRRCCWLCRGSSDHSKVALAGVRVESLSDDDRVGEDVDVLRGLLQEASAVLWRQAAAQVTQGSRSNHSTSIPGGLGEAR
jgi:hypothetical protein